MGHASLDHRLADTTVRHRPERRRDHRLLARGTGRSPRTALEDDQVTAAASASLVVVGLDAVDGTPMVDLQPVMRESLPREAVTQPRWSTELMRDYW